MCACILRSATCKYMHSASVGWRTYFVGELWRNHQIRWRPRPDHNHAITAPMTVENIPQLPSSIRHPQGLAKALVQNEHVEALVQESASELASANAALKQDVERQPLAAGVTAVLAKTEAVEDKIDEASRRLSAINQALETQVRDRHMLDNQLAAVTQQEAAARHAALHDALTDLPNRALFSDRLEHGLAHARRHGERVAVLFVDLDNFKFINDTYGHEAGDSVLRTVGQRLRETTRDVDTISRYGGDEFLFLLSEVRDEMVVSAFVEKLIATIQLPCMIALPEGDIPHIVKASVGIALFPHHGTTADALVHSADTAMYRAKRNKAGFAFSEPVGEAACK